MDAKERKRRLVMGIMGITNSWINYLLLDESSEEEEEDMNPPEPQKRKRDSDGSLEEMDAEDRLYMRIMENKNFWLSNRHMFGDESSEVEDTNPPEPQKRKLDINRNMEIEGPMERLICWLNRYECPTVMESSTLFQADFEHHDMAIQLRFEMDLNDSKAMESITSTGTKIIKDIHQEANVFTHLLNQSESKLKRYVTVELDLQDLDTMRKLMASQISGRIKVIYDNDNQEFETAMRYKLYEMSRMLVEIGAVDVHFVGPRGTPLHLALQARDHDLCGALIEAGSDVNQKDNFCYTALMEAAYKGYEEVVRILIEAGSDVNQKENNGFTALILASQECHEKVVRILIEAGSNVNQTNKDGLTALMGPAYNGHAQISRILLENGADFTAKDSHGETALDKAKEYSKNEETIELFEYATRLHRTTLFIQSIEYLRNHRQEYEEEEEVREYIPDHVMKGFFRNTIWKKDNDSK